MLRLAILLALATLLLTACSGILGERPQDDWYYGGPIVPYPHNEGRGADF